MGKLLSVLRNPGSKDADVFVDFENAQPTEIEEETYRNVENVLKQAKAILVDLQAYKGAMVEIREAINNPQSEEAQKNAWEAVQTHVVNLKSYYDFSKELENIVSLLLIQLCSRDMTSMEHLERQQALFRQFAEILDFTLSFDEAKMTTPSVQNDFSYYRRRANQIKMLSPDGPGNEEADEGMTSEVQGRMSLFFAESRPMMKCVSDTTSRFVAEHDDVTLENATETLAKMAAICRVMITAHDYRERLANGETVMFILRVMVGVLILYDHVHPDGAFVKNHRIEMEKYAKVLKQYAADTNLLDALKYTSKHFSDSTTPDSIKKSFS
ncbi:CYFIP-related Rac1 interactor B-like [Watersipora subatra]|uniref:CYFIP-related Rac1 interactor B-like n=1 Tax=Watersipora subatra TaxID=2589382 RepID=UPI00355B5721